MAGHPERRAARTGDHIHAANRLILLLNTLLLMIVADHYD